MENQSLALTLGVGVTASFALFFFIYKGLGKSGKMAALLTILITQAVYIPLSVLYWDGLDVYAIHFAFFTMTAYGLGIITSTRDAQAQKEGAAKKRWFHWVPAIIVTFFLVLAVVDSIIITLANKGASAEFVRSFLPTPHGKEVGKEVTSAFSGAVANDFQKNIAQYNRYVDELRQQAALGWRIMDGWVDAPVAGKPALFRLRVIDDEGMPVTGAQVSVQFMFTADKSHDTEVVLPEVGPGSYGEPVTLPQSGLWALLINVNRGKDVYEVRGETKVGVVGATG